MLSFLVFYNDVELSKIENPLERTHISIISSEIIGYIERNFNDMFDDLIYIRYGGSINNLEKVVSVSSGKVKIRETIYPALRNNGFHDYLSHLVEP